jgi:CBS domain-containing protein
MGPDLFTGDPENLRRALVPVGMAGVLSASMRVPLAALVMVTEMTGSYGLIVPLMVVCISSYVVGRRWGLSDEQVRSSPESPAHAGDVVIHLLEAGRVGNVMVEDWPDVVRPETTLGELVRRVQPGTRPTFAVVEHGRFKGTVSVPEITNIMEEPGISELVVAADILTADPVTLTPDDDLYVALAVMARNKDQVVPVVARERGHRFVGMLTRSGVYRSVRTQLNDLRKNLVLEHKGLAEIEREEALHQLVTGVSARETESIKRLIVPVQAVGQSLREADFRRQFGVQVIAIEQADGSIECPPDVDAPLRTNQRLLAIRGQSGSTEEPPAGRRPVAEGRE